ncbi:hypothetical protein [Methanolapillus ohkumae]|uniref:Uncharacterized protein n=1 Tax=Methanolapillus ohkumae TaxID=3028298 RepID=A0AA96V4X5_9EURY|nr:hypothetical protein MsAm2_04510 [Methanosarcinaceae archaeon Am2]
MADKAVMNKYCCCYCLNPNVTVLINGSVTAVKNYSANCNVIGITFGKNHMSQIIQSPVTVKCNLCHMEYEIHLKKEDRKTMHNIIDKIMIMDNEINRDRFSKALCRENMDFKKMKDHVYGCTLPKIQNRLFYRQNFIKNKISYHLFIKIENVRYCTQIVSGNKSQPYIFKSFSR